MKKIFNLVLFLSSGFFASANHITGGTIFYTFEGVNNGLYTYEVTLLLYRDHSSTGAQLDLSAAISIFNKQSGASVWANVVALDDTSHLRLGSPDPCIDSPPEIWYEVGRYTFTVTLPASSSGYIITYQRCCRIAGINNLVGSSNVGATYTAEIPGTNTFTTPAAPELAAARV